MKKLLAGILCAVTVFLASPSAALADSAQGTTFEVTKTATPSTASPSSTVSFTISIKNLSSANAAPQTVTDTLPAGFTFKNDAKLTLLDGSQVNFAPSAAGQVLTWTFDGDTLQSIPQNDNIVISFSTTAPATVGNYTNQGCLTQPENVCATAAVTIQTSPAAGLEQNILMISTIAAVFIAASYFLMRRKVNFEERLIQRF